MRASRLLLIVALFGAVAVIACGGGGGGGGGTPPPSSTLRITQSELPDGLEGQPYSVQFSASGGKGAITWRVLDSNAPWLTLEPSSGKASGTPQFPGNYYVLVQAKDSGSQAVDVTVSIWISGIMSVSPQPEDAIRGYYYNWQAAVNGGKPPFTVSVSAGSMPSGLTLKLDGQYLQLTGTSQDLGDFTFSLQFKDSASTPQILMQEFRIRVLNVLKITSQRLKNGVVGRSYSDSVLYTNGTAPLQWTLTEGTGLSINPTGVITGTPTYPRDMLWVRVTDSSTPQQSDERYLYATFYDVLHVGDPVTAVTGHVNEPFQFQLSAQGGVPPVIVSLASGATPPGISLVNNQLLGTPTAPGTWNVGLRYSDAAVPPQTYDQPVVVTVLPPRPVILNLPSTPLVGEPYSYQMLASDGTPPFTWDVVSGTLPAGISLSQNGVLSGTAVLGGDYSFDLRVTDSATPAQSATKSAFLRIPLRARGRNDSVATAATANPWSTEASLSPFENPLGTAAPDTDYYRLYALGGSTVTVNVQPQKTPSTSYEYASPTDTVLEIVDANGVRFATCRDVADDVAIGPLAVDPTPAAYDDDCLNDDVELGVQVNSRLEFKVPGESNKVSTFFAHVLDFQGSARPDMLYSMQVSGAMQPVSIIGEDSFVAVKNLSTVINLQAIGGSGTYIWSIQSGDLPPGLALTTSATIAGTPTTAGTWVLTVKATDKSIPAISVTKTLAIRVAEPLRLTTNSLPAGQTGVPYTAQLTWTGGTSPFKFFNSGLPPGISLSSTGLLSGIPTTSESYFFSISIVDADNRSDVKGWTVNITTGPLYVSTTTLPNATKNAIYSAMVTGAGGKQPYAWQITSGALPPGMALNASTGEVRGIPTSTGVYSFTVKVTDANAATATATLQLTVQ